MRRDRLRVYSQLLDLAKSDMPGKNALAYILGSSVWT
jgi:hypothetical protein